MTTSTDATRRAPRRFGPMAPRASSLIALPFVVILVTPYLPNRHSRPTPAVPMAVIVALLWIAAFHAPARRVRMVLPARRTRASPVTAAAGLSRCPVASTRMAIRVAPTLGASFVVDCVFFSERRGWSVFTAF
jgi:hypothetical protein